MKNKTLVYATYLALITAVISGFSNFLNKIAVTVVKDPIVFTTLKNSLVAIFIIGAILVFKKLPEILSLNKKQIFKLFLIGIIGGSLPFALFFTGLTQTSAINASLIHKTLFIWVLLLAIPILKERISKMQWLGIGAIFAANLIVGGFAGFKYNAGELMILAATILWAIENVIAKIALKDISSLTVASARMAIGSFILLSFVFVKGGTSAVLSLNQTQWLWTFIPAILLFGYVITWYTALKYAPATYVATLLVPATLVTNVLSAIFITRAFTLLQLVSATLFIFGAMLVIFFAKKSAAIPQYGRIT
jgi:drug/metabolite transporter (DMT)-like permease